MQIQIVIRVCHILHYQFCFWTWRHRRIHNFIPQNDKLKIYQKWYAGPTLVFFPREATRSAVLPRQVVWLSVCPSVCDVEVSWSYRLEFLENNFTADKPNHFALCRPQHGGSTPKRTPQILAGIGVVVGRENCRFSTFKPPYLWNGARRLQVPSF